jgi:molecular chaperone GrpE
VTDRSAGGSASPGPPKGDNASSGEERVVVRDKRKIDPTGTKPKTGKPAPTKPAAPEKPEKPAAEAAPEPKEASPVEAEAAKPVEGEVVTEPPEADEGEEKPVVEHPLGAELEAVRAELDERTRDLQRVGAEYANYRKRVDRDRGVVVEQALGSVLASLLPVLDDLDRARDHGDLVGPFASVADQLTGALAKFGLTPFGEKGDPFDPARHEAVAHLTSAEVTEPTCIDVLRRGYLLGDRLLRAALVAVADPEPESE